MHEKADAQLLRETAQLGSEAAFREMVERPTDFVYSASLRHVESPDITCDIAQSLSQISHGRRNRLPSAPPRTVRSPVKARNYLTSFCAWMGLGTFTEEIKDWVEIQPGAGGWMHSVQGDFRFLT